MKTWSTNFNLSPFLSNFKDCNCNSHSSKSNSSEDDSPFLSNDFLVVEGLLLDLSLSLSQPSSFSSSSFSLSSRSKSAWNTRVESSIYWLFLGLNDWPVLLLPSSDLLNNSSKELISSLIDWVVLLFPFESNSLFEFEFEFVVILIVVVLLPLVLDEEDEEEADASEWAKACNLNEEVELVKAGGFPDEVVGVVGVVDPLTNSEAIFALETGGVGLREV